MKTTLSAASCILLGLGLAGQAHAQAETVAQADTLAQASEPSFFSFSQPGEEVLTAPPGAGGFQLGGYFRSGAGSSSKGGKEACFRLPGATMGFYRLGNECDTYLSLDFKTSLGKVGETEFKATFTMAAGTQQLANWEQSTPSWRQAFVEVTNIGSGMRSPALKGATVWAGKRFYKNPDVHMLDFGYWEPGQGPGAGIDGIDLGKNKGKLSYALFRVGDFKGYGTQSALGGFNPDIINGGDATVTVHDIRVADIPVNPGGALTVGMDLVRANNHDGVAGKNGHAFTVSHKQSNLLGLGGFNNLVLQYAKDAADLKGFGYAGSTRNYQGTRLLDNWVIEPKDSRWRASLVAGVERNRLDGKTTTIYTIGARPQYHFNQLVSLATEIGHQIVKPQDGETRRLTKFTIAPQISLGSSIWSRPALRAYYTYAKWNDAAKAAGNVACTGRDCNTPIGAFGGSTSGSSVGVQVEAWF